MELGVLPDGKKLNYSEAAYTFFLDSEPIDLHKVRCMDRKGVIHWHFHEQRDWMWKLDRATLEAAQARALNLDPSSLSLDDQIKLHAAKNDSYIHGHIVDETPAAGAAQAAQLVAAQRALAGERAGESRHAGQAGHSAHAAAKAGSASAGCSAARMAAPAVSARTAAAAATAGRSGGSAAPAASNAVAARSAASASARSVAPAGPFSSNEVTMTINSTEAPKPVRLVPPGLGGFLYKALGFEKADKQLGYRILHDPIELQNPNNPDDSEPSEEALAQAELLQEAETRDPVSSQAYNGFESLKKIVNKVPVNKNDNGNKELHLFS